jgi:hypothetical protein
MAAAAREWRRSNEEADAILRRLHPSRWTRVRYEALCARPAETLSALFAFIGVEAVEPRLDFRSVEHHVIGNGMRLDPESPIQLDDRWRSVLGREDLALFDSVAGAMNGRLGYS